MGSAKQHRPAWRYDAGALLWQLSFTLSGTIFGQKRLAAERRSLFFSLDPSSGKVLLDDFQPLDPLSGEPIGGGWLVGIESTHEQLVYLHAWQEGSPLHRGIWALEAESGRHAWSRPDLEHAAHLPEGILACRQTSFAGFPERTYLLLDPLTGEERPSLDAASHRMRASSEEERQGISLPDEGVRLPDGREGGESIVSGGCVAGAFHESQHGGWRSSLRIWKDGREVYGDVMEERGLMPARNNFLRRGDKLYYIKEKRELVALPFS
ncbi:hypothetical protein [Chlorobium sp. N1]|uniref:hypothetical protein n=1 Tax=Chlorobium sp. N1 TaxID=2491138 RepID=UPI00103EB949|nr:hypothetical protein [Chlorobium sp. N1]TCD48752.1 hypothetical protein E0L29_02400 [Chlorobium sp. N1]